MTDDRFGRAEQKYRLLRGELGAGRISPEQFEVALWDSKIDVDGRYWMLGAETGRWYAQEGQSWVAATPPRTGNPPVVGEQPPVAPPAEPATVPAEPGRTTPVRVLAGVLVLVLVVGVVGWFLVGLGYAIVASLQETFGLALGGTISGLVGLVILGVIAWGVRARRRNANARGSRQDDLPAD